MVNLFFFFFYLVFLSCLFFSLRGLFLFHFDTHTLDTLFLVERERVQKRRKKSFLSLCLFITSHSSTVNSVIIPFRTSKETGLRKNHPFGGFDRSCTDGGTVYSTVLTPGTHGETNDIYIFYREQEDRVWTCHTHTHLSLRLSISFSLAISFVVK